MIAQVVAVLLLATSVYSVQFNVINNGGQNMLIQTLGSATVPAFTLAPHAQKAITFGATWSGRIWGRVDCLSEADCAKAGVIPLSLFELTIQNGNAWYDISFVDGFNIPLSVTPVGGKTDGTKYRCTKAQCNVNLLATCPKELQLVKNGKLVACQSACNALNTDLYCCRGAHNTPATCKESDFPVDYPKFFKSACPDAYSYAYDDNKSTFTCDATTYTVTFG